MNSSSDGGVETVFLSIGSNLGDRLSNCKAAITEITRDAAKATLIAASSFYETEAWISPKENAPSEPLFVNAAVKIKTSLKPKELLSFLKAVEKKLGRAERQSPWPEPRPVDIDIIFYGSLEVDEPELKIPHPRAHQRGFVLAPLSEMEPGLTHPLLGKTVEELLAEMTNTGIIRKVC